MARTYFETALNDDLFYIDGAWVEPAKANTLAIINPATDSELGQLAMGCEADVNRAVAAARAAFEDYAHTSKEQRLNWLTKLLALYEQNYEEMAQLMTLELGVPIDHSRSVQADTGTGHLKAVIDVLQNYEFEETNVDGELIFKEPVGVCGLITPWNWPINQIVLKVLPALAAGCTMVLKPSELTPLSGLLFADLVHQAGFPPGVFNMVNGDGANVGAPISAHPEVDLVSFTGSTRAGILVAEAASKTVKRVAQELGGKSPNIILDDADLAQAVSEGVLACFGNSGQSCDAPSRMLIHESQYAAAVGIAASTAQSVTVGDPTLPGDHLGPVISQQQYNKIQALIQIGIDEGATLVAGGTGKPAGVEQGYFVKPTVFADVTNDMRIAREEVFGPVIALIPYASDEEAIHIANDTEYGLASYISGGDMQRLMAVARRLRAGNVCINGAGPSYTQPFGGYKRSGNGREGGVHGFEEFLEIKAVCS